MKGYVGVFALATIVGTIGGVAPAHSAPRGTLANVSMVLPNEMVVLTRGIVEGALASIPPGTPPIGPPFRPRFTIPGVMMIPFRDGPASNLFGMQRPAYYEMYLKVERMP